MEHRQKLHIELRSPIPDFIACLERHLTQAWERGHKAEEGVRIGEALPEQYCFVLKTGHRRAPADVWIREMSPTLVWAGDVLPHSGQLSLTECNQILQMFLDQVVTPAAKECSAQVSIDPPSGNLELEDLLSPSAAEKLRKFSMFTNKKTGPANEDEIELWNDFLIEAHQTGWELTTHDLGRWLCEEEKWPPKRTDQVMLAYEFAQNLLKAYDKKLGR
jgi:hypothetical protein